jgi:hypothetical protein
MMYLRGDFSVLGWNPYPVCKNGVPRIEKKEITQHFVLCFQTLWPSAHADEN